DAAPDDALASVCAPTSLSYSFIAYSPDDNQCLDDAVSLASTGQAAPISREAWLEYRACSGADDFHRIEVQPGESVEVFAIFSKGQQVQLTLLDGEQREMELFR